MAAMQRALAAAGVILLFLFLWEQVQATRSGYEAGSARFELRRQQGRIAYLRLEAERLSSPQAVAQRAAQRLGMGPARPEYVYVLGSGPRTAADRALSRGSAASTTGSAAARAPRVACRPQAPKQPPGTRIALAGGF